MKSKERIKAGFRRMKEQKALFLFPALWLLFLSIAAYKGQDILQKMGHPFSSDFFQTIYVIFAVEMAIIGVCTIMSLVGTPLGAARTEEDLAKIVFRDKGEGSPILLSRRKDGKRVELEFFSQQIPSTEYEKHKELLETALNMKILSFRKVNDMRHIVINATIESIDRKTILPWQDSYLSNKDFELVLGKSDFGTESVNIDSTPHLLIGGGSGSGKSKLLKLILMESIKKGAKVFLADLKGGVDFLSVWHQHCNIITEQSELDSQLSQIHDEMERRRDLFVEAHTSNIKEYNAKSCAVLPRLIVACDEVAEVLDKTGLTKEEKELVGRVESKLSKIARQGRAFGIHLILATQRPDADIVKGQIKVNIGYRICGRADKVLSQIILDNSEGAEMISPDDQGMFRTNTGVLFKAYYVEDDCLKGVEVNGSETA